uniref:Transmembrane protein 273 n=1 Tax=Castor canadensis TaxID=51338 RepID=A0A8C0XSH6_CASCN
WTGPTGGCLDLTTERGRDARAQVLATGKSAEAEIDFKYALIGTALGVAISAGFLALKICIIRKHLSENDSSDLRSSRQGGSGKRPMTVRFHRPYSACSEKGQCVN